MRRDEETDRPRQDRLPGAGRHAGDYSPMLTQAATARIDLPAASTTQVISSILDALAGIEAEGR